LNLFKMGQHPQYKSQFNFEKKSFAQLDFNSHSNKIQNFQICIPKTLG